MKYRLQCFWWDLGYLIVGMSLFTSMIVGATLLIYSLDKTACVAKWAEKSSYSFYTGCMVDGIPEKNIRIYITGE